MIEVGTERCDEHRSAPIEAPPRQWVSVEDLVEYDLSVAERGRLRQRAQHAVGFGVLGTHTSAHFDDVESAQNFAYRYGDLRSDGPVVRRTYAVRNDDGQMCFWSGDDAAYCWPHDTISPRLTAFFADAFASLALLSSIPSAVALHAAAMRWNGAAFALTGLSGAGKSTTAMACVGLGAQLYSDERCVMTPDATVPYPRALNIRSGGLELLVDTLPECALRDVLTPHRGKDWESVRFDEIFGANSLPEPAPLRALFAIVGRDTVPSSRPISAVTMLPLAERGANVHGRGIDRVRMLLENLQRVTCFELVLGTPVDSARHILARIDELTGR